MKIYHHNLLAFSFLLLIFSHNLSSLTIEGKVITIEDGSPLFLPGAIVQIQNTNYGAVANSEGIFKIDIKNEKKIDLENIFLLVSATAYKSKIVKYNNEFIEIELKSNNFQTDNIVVSANKKLESIQDVPISVSLISSQDLKMRQMNSVEVALQYVPGVQVNRDNLSIRGSSGFSYGVGSRVSMLIDGFPILSGDNGDIKFDALPMFNTKSIEVVKGAGSALYGTSAIGGVVNLITDNNYDDNLIDFRVYSGFYTKPKYDSWVYQDELSFDSGFDFTIKKKFNDLGILINTGLVDRNSWRDYDKKQIINSLVKLDYKINSFQKLKFISNISIAENDDWAFWNGLDSATIPPSTVDRSIKVNSDKYAFLLGYENILNNSTIMNIKSGLYLTEYYNNYPKDNEEYRQSKANSYNNEIQFNSILSKDNNLTYGTNILVNDVNSAVYSDRQQRIYSAYSQYERKQVIDLFGAGINWIFTLGARVDYEDIKDIDSEIQFSPKIGNNFKLNENNTLKISGGRGFRAPQIAERFSQIRFQGFQVIENLDLVPETSWSAELAYTHENKIFGIPVLLDIAFFQNNMSNLIEATFDANTAASIQFQNVSEARIRGVETSIKALFGDFGFDFSTTILDPVDLSASNFGEVLKYRSKFVSQNKFFYQFNSLRFELDYRYYSRIDRIDDLLALQIKDANVRNHSNIVDVRLNYNTKKLLGDYYDYDLTLNCFNIFDYYYTQMVGNLGKTRHISLQLRASI